MRRTGTVTRDRHDAAPAVRRIFAAAAVLIFASGLSGCVYFNTFYHAKQYFQKAEKQNQPARGKTRGVSTGKRMYEDAIGKAIIIVDDHPDSKYHDDALFMIGVSYFRMDEYAKSERSFRELLAQHPESNFIEESRLYLARCRIQLGDAQAGFRTFTELAATARKPEWRAEAIFQRGEYFAENNAHDSAVAAYLLVIEEYPESDRALEARLWAAEELRLLDRPEEAITLYEPLMDEKDPLLRYEVLLGTGEAWYEAGRFDSGIAVFVAMVDEDDYQDSVGTVRLLWAKGLASVGDRPAAWRQYEQITATFEKSVWSAEAYFKMAEMRQFYENDLLGAKELYDASRQESSRGEIANKALARSANITKLAQFRKDLGRGELARGGILSGASLVVAPEDLPPLERDPTYSVPADRPRTAIEDEAVVWEIGPPSPLPGAGAPFYGPPTPSEEPESDGVSDSAALANTEPYGPPSDLAPTFGPPISRGDIEFNRKRNDLLDAYEWWQLVDGDSLAGPPSPAFIYPFGASARLGPVSPSDSVLEAWAEAEANNPVLLERKERKEARVRRKEALADSKVQAGTQLQLAELYRFDLDKPDSAVTEYDQMAEAFAGTPFGAQALLAAADTYEQDLGDTLEANRRLRRVLAEYPYSDYASEAVARLGLKGTPADTAHPVWAYAHAEQAFIDADDPKTGIERLKQFVGRYPHSRLVPTAEYTIVALTEKYFASGDSSVIWAYQEIVIEYAGSEIAGAAQEQLRTTIVRPRRRERPVLAQVDATEGADSLADTTSEASRLPLAPKEKHKEPVQFPQSEVGSDMRQHVVVYKILIDFVGEIAQYDLIQPSPSFDVNEATRVALEKTTFWADSIPPDSLNIWYRYEMTIRPPARELDEFDRLGIDRTDPGRKNLNP